MRCSRCRRSVTEADREFCWVCLSALCDRCWEEFGKCDHPAEETERVLAARTEPAP